VPVSGGASLTKGFHTKASLARTACELLGRNGFHGTGLNDLIAASGAPRGSLYYHFPGGKAEMVAAGLEIARADTASLLRNAFAGQKPIQEKVTALFGHLTDSMKDDVDSYGCPVAAVALDNFGGDDGIRTQCESIFATWRNAIESSLLQTDPEQRAAMATMILLTYEGSLVSARVMRNPSVLTEAGRSLANILCSPGERNEVLPGKVSSAPR
jgi:TetR/AcrR family transcriptional regulator, lmrAB and yxaGH operons repressor